ncbi:hypothetical protein LCGC14_2760240 [marine sediment metagenome]|uniref:Uncharacterized protein n=1 Tax=marine sediment metagenome TaxID=412755 RepID=A0A0F8YZ90_9ZZZZ
MQSYWLTFTDGSVGCCEGQGEYDAKRIAEHVTGKTVAGGKYSDIAAEVLPYPANPIIWQFNHPISGVTPTFCHRPETCKGRGACPESRSCTE